jgi:hypothetical protein
VSCLPTVLPKLTAPRSAIFLDVCDLSNNRTIEEIKRKRCLTVDNPYGCTLIGREDPFCPRTVTPNLPRVSIAPVLQLQKSPTLIPTCGGFVYVQKRCVSCSDSRH